MNYEIVHAIVCLLLAIFFQIAPLSAQTIVLWTFDEPQGGYPSTVLSDHGPNDYPLVIGLGGQIVEGKFGNALEPIEHPDRALVIERLKQYTASFDEDEGILFGLRTLPIPEGRTVEPMSWLNANFCA
ncbi:MAG: hypothetical protein ONB13_11075, partial [candidate division KSB1 bacterium]|nr:hypothetical protein [candidate division KSB1 bacterium]